ncbi:hypothetical protein Dda_4367 [Drechslerella dactyloides]|uniref:F-box domain-containing protein n=1 Tax=Drechslerella dactyloides TaxID=74499 RepID=A0AAD6IWU4_DREDA|nr:hypothetical protein Dda_4367 [Drechslerella dactyloides]
MNIMLPLPAELLIEIFSYLNNTDVKNLSLCSKSHRVQVLPFLFESFKLASPQSLKAFQDGGKLSWLRFNVRHIRLSGLHDAPIGRTLDRTHTYPAVLHRFPNATDLTVPCNIHSQIQYNVLHYLFKRIAKTPIYRSLKCLTLTCSDERRFPNNDFKLSDHYQTRFGMIPRGPMDLPLALGIPSPPVLEELSITTDGCFHFHKPENSTDVSFLGFYLLQPSLANTLKRLEIRAHGLKMLQPRDTTGKCNCHTGLGQGPSPSCAGMPHIYTSVSKLKVHIDCFCGSTSFVALAATFPNVEDLEVELLRGLAPPPTLHECRELVIAKKLKRIRIPSPYIYTSGYEDGLRSLVIGWVKGGLTHLERAELARCEAGHRNKLWLCEVLREEGLCVLRWGQARRPNKADDCSKCRLWRPYTVSGDEGRNAKLLEYDQEGYTAYPLPDDEDNGRPESPAYSGSEWGGYSSFWSDGFDYNYEYPGDLSESSGAEDRRTRGELTWGRETSQKLRRRRKDGDKRKAKPSRKHALNLKGGRKASPYKTLEPPEDLYWHD